jgi:hypothetical protein
LYLRVAAPLLHEFPDGHIVFFQHVQNKFWMIAENCPDVFFEIRGGVFGRRINKSGLILASEHWAWTAPIGIQILEVLLC